ncbi:hypothetical protein [Desulfobulbus rhabdoformis]|nr:hypothetical protein [Desulfobulbus rhabdoformis]
MKVNQSRFFSASRGEMAGKRELKEVVVSGGATRLRPVRPCIT